MTGPSALFARSVEGDGWVMFVSHEVAVPTGYEVAAGRLSAMIREGGLQGVSEPAYLQGWQALVRVGPFGDLAGLSKLVRVRLTDPVRRGGTLTVSLRWEATGPAGELFPVLDADLMLMPDGDGRSQLGVVGSYRPPLGTLGAALDRAILSRVALATIRRLLTDLAAALAEPEPDVRPVTATPPIQHLLAEPGAA